uniref:PKD domain-containing protein n=1 Tax=Corallococcus coralloides TaxID=184914 RepID=UPI000FFEAA3C|nr:PKD domain-containing protein [Corallococcus coralloides]
MDGFHALGDSGYTHATAAAWLQPSTTTGTGNDAWSLDYGDGSAQVTGRGRPTALQTHRYTAKGTYRASLTVTDWKGVRNTDTRVLTVK